MTVFKTFFKVLKNYKISLIIYLSISIGVTAMLAGMSGGSDNKYSTTSHGLVVIDNDDSEISRELVAFLDEVNVIKEGDFTDEQIAQLMYYTKISNYLIIPEGFGDAFEAGTIPIYYGDDTVLELLNNRSYVHVIDERDFDEKIEWIKKIDQNDTLYEQMIREKIVIDDSRYPREVQKYKDFIYHIIDQDKEKAKRFERRKKEKLNN